MGWGVAFEAGEELRSTLLTLAIGAPLAIWAAPVKLS